LAMMNPSRVPTAIRGVDARSLMFALSFITRGGAHCRELHAACARSTVDKARLAITAMVRIVQSSRELEWNSCLPPNSPRTALSRNASPTARQSRYLTKSATRYNPRQVRQVRSSSCGHKQSLCVRLAYCAGQRLAKARIGAIRVNYAPSAKAVQKMSSSRGQHHGP
jgi:hypothetical protein